MKVPAGIIILLLLLFTGASSAHSRNISLPTDTVIIYKRETGVRYRTYQRNWFFGIGIRNRYGWDPSKMNRQDSLVMISSNTPRYFRVYRRNNQLLMEGQRGQESTYLEGDVKFYYRSGQLKRIEHWNNDYRIDTCEYTFGLNDAPGAEGTWKYFRKNGSLRKQLDYSVQVFSCDPLSYCYRKTITRYNRRGRIREQQHKHWFCFKRNKNEKSL